MKLLLVEDDPGQRAELVRDLSRVGFVVETAGDLKEAAQALALETFGAVILDRMLPDGDGLVELQKWRRQDLQTPVLMLTALDEVPQRVQALQDGADDFLGKPFAAEELIARLRILLRRHQEARPAVERFGPFELDWGNQRLCRDRILLPLNRKEFAVLELLIRRQGQVVSKQELFDQCWGWQSDSISNVVEVVVASLRRKLKPGRWIFTVRGFGYRFDLDLGEAS
ncbi:MAG: DNA-binding response regulator [Planctomycetota bacterium]|nr:MAG: DNA-binding response regulator [Planctomycetota bacterium]